MENSNLKKFQGQKLNEAGTANVKGGIDYNALINNAVNYTVFGGYGECSWLYRLVKK